MKLNTTQIKSFMYGNMLGDGNIHNGAFATAQINEDLILFKEKIFKQYFGFSKTKVLFKKSYTSKDGIKRKDSWRIYVSPNRYFKKLQKDFYRDKKTLPVTALDKLDSLGLAIWFADDGTTVHVGYNENTGSANKRRVEICTDAYSYEEVVRIKGFFEKRYGTTSIIKRGDCYRVRINNYDAQKFLIEISYWFIKYFPSLLYKLDMGYRNESLDNERYVTKEYKELYSLISSHDGFIDRIQLKLSQ